MVNDGKDALHLAEAEVQYWRDELDSRRTEVEQAQARLEDTERKLRTTEAFLQILRERYGLHAEEGPTSRFAGLPLSEAALMVIREKGRISNKELLAELAAGGFPFTNYPGRQLHAALIHRKQAVKDQNGIWRWLGAEQTALPMGREVKQPR